MSSSPPETDGFAELTDRVREARGLALRRLAELQGQTGSWCLPIPPNGMPSAAFVILLRATGLIEAAGQFEIERELMRGAPSYANPDGGMWKYPGSPSSRSVTRCVSGCFAAGARRDRTGGCKPASRFRRNPLLDAVLERELREGRRPGRGFFLRRDRPVPAGCSISTC